MSQVEGMGSTGAGPGHGPRARRRRHRARGALLAGAVALGVAAAAAPGQVAGATPSPQPDAVNVQDDLAAAHQRAAALVAQMTLEEKVSQVHGTGFITGNGYTGFTPAVPRLGIPRFYLADGPNGVGNGAQGVTAFPAAISNASTWDSALLRRYGQVLGTEHLGKGNDVALAPTINILRVPGWGRSFETLSEDPVLTGELAAAEVQGLQSTGVIADVKHYAVNNQESDRDTVDARVDERTLREVYTRQFEQAITEGGALSAMCAYNRVNGAYACENEHLLTDVLKHDWRFQGFVVSDWFATHSTAPAANAGLDLEMPGGTGPLFPGGLDLPEYLGQRLEAAVEAGQVPVARLDDMVTRILTARIAVGELDRGDVESHDAVVTTDQHQAFARDLSAQGTVLLKNTGDVLPLRAGTSSIAVVGAAAQDQAIYTGGGSASVVPSATTTPLDGIRARAGSDVTVTYAPGTSGTAPLPTVPGALLAPAQGGGTGLTAAYFASPDLTGDPVLTRVEPTAAVSAPPPGLSGTWSARLTGTFTPTVSGPQRFSLVSGGTVRLYVGGALVATNYSQFPGSGVGHAVVDLPAGTPADLRVEYVGNTGFGLPGSFAVGYEAPDPTRLQTAVDAARAADVAVVVVNDVRSEGADLTSLALPGDQDALVDAVAAANPRTVVVLNTGGPTLMPWVDRVAGVVEAWYPGQENGAALARVLFGDVNPSGHLPVVFPRSDEQGPLGDPQRFPGVGGSARYEEGLLVGQRWFDATGEQPLFPLGHGLSYTDFAYSDLQVRRLYGDPDVEVTVAVTNTGDRAGAEVPQLYVGAPAASGEPPRVLKGFDRVELAPGQTRTVTFRLTRQDLSRWDTARGTWVRDAGRYTFLIGSSSRDVRAGDTLVLDQR